MSEFNKGNVALRTNDKLVLDFPTESKSLVYDGTDAYFNLTVRADEPTQTYHLTTKNYVDTEIGSLTVNHSELNELDYASAGHTGFASSVILATTSGALQQQIDAKPDTDHIHDDRYYTDSEVNTISGSLQIQIDAKPDSDHLHTLLGLTDTPSVYDAGKFLSSTGSSTEWTTISGGEGVDHSVLGNLDYTNANHTGFTSEVVLLTTSGSLQIQIDAKPDSDHIHDGRYYTESELDAGQLDNRYYTETEADALLYQKLDTAGGTIENDLVVRGNFTVSGTQFITETETVLIEDNLLVINYGEQGAGVTAGEAGIEIDRGSATNYRFMFDETNDFFMVGISGVEQAVATREDTPTNNLVPYWNASQYRFDTDGSVDHTDLSSTIQKFTDMNEPNGFENTTDTTLSFDNDELTFTISGTNYSFYASGIKYTKNTGASVQIPNTEGIHYVYFDTAGVLQSTITFSSDLIRTYAFVCRLYWDATPSASGTIFLGDERHGYIMDGRTHEYLHNTSGSQYTSGLALLDITVDGNGNDAIHAQLGTEAGIIWDEDMEISIPGEGIPAQIPVFYKDGATPNWRRATIGDYPVISFVGGSGRLAYNEFTGGAWQQTEVPNAQFVLAHFFASADINYPILSIQGEDSYATKAEADTAATDEIFSIGTTGMPFLEFVPIGTVILQTNTSYSNAPKARIVSTVEGGDYKDFRAVTGAGISTSIGDHGALSGLTDDDHTHYFRVDGTRAMSGDLDLGGNGVNYGSVLTVSGTYAGDYFTATVDDAQSRFGKLLYQAADFNYERADATNNGTMPGFVIALGAGAGSQNLLVRGQVCDTDWNWNAGYVYASIDAGELTQTLVSGSGNVLQEVGRALSADTIFFTGDSSTVEIL